MEIGPMPAGEGAAGRSNLLPRFTERHVLALGTAISGAFILAALVVALRTALVGGPIWAALHLALVGGTTVAIATFMPHFAVTLSGSRPAPTGWRLVALVLLASGAIGVVVGLTDLGPAWTGAGAVLAIGGVLATGILTVLPTRNPLARRHPIATAAYLFALVELVAAMAIGAAGGIAMPAFVAEWGSLRPAHAWLALFGSVSLTIFATLVYLAPTILGARIRPSPWLAIGLGGVAVGPIVTAGGFVANAQPVVAAGMAVTLAGGIGQIAYVVDVYRRRGRFTSEHDWRRLSVLHLTAGTLWFAAAVGMALADVLAGGRILGWSLGLLALPMVAGWMLQELVGSWTYLVPAVTPGDPVDHALQRRALAPLSRVRPIAWNAGLALACVGLAVGAVPLAAAGVVLVGTSVAISLVTLARALAVARR